MIKLDRPALRAHHVPECVAWWVAGALLYVGALAVLPDLSFLAYLLIPTCVAMLAWLIRDRQTRRRGGDGFMVTDGAFEIRTSPALSTMLILSGFMGTPNLLEGDLLMAAGLSFVGAAGILAQPRLRLTPNELEVRGGVIPNLPWAGGILSVEVVRDARLDRGLRLTLSGPVRPGRVEKIPFGLLGDYDMIAMAIREYSTHPEHRTAIGSEVELLRLRALFAARSSGESPSPDRV